jgi:hypothetical protein
LSYFTEGFEQGAPPKAKDIISEREFEDIIKRDIRFRIESHETDML